MEAWYKQHSAMVVGFAGGACDEGAWEWQHLHAVLEGVGEVEGAVAGPVVHMSGLAKIPKRLCDLHLQPMHTPFNRIALLQSMKCHNPGNGHLPQRHTSRLSKFQPLWQPEKPFFAKSIAQ